MQRLEKNIVTGECQAVDLTQAEETYATACAVEVATATQPSVLAAKWVDLLDRLQFEVLFNHENRIRAREGLQNITAAQFRTALINRWIELHS